jgi:hypothetical protein
VVDVIDESAVLNKARLTLDSVLVNKVVYFGSSKLNIQSTDTGAESSLSDPSFTELIEIQEEFLDSNSVFGSQGLEFSLNVVLGLQFV